MGPLKHICGWANRYQKDLTATLRLLNMEGKH